MDGIARRHINQPTAEPDEPARARRSVRVRSAPSVTPWPDWAPRIGQRYRSTISAPVRRGSRDRRPRLEHLRGLAAMDARDLDGSHPRIILEAEQDQVAGAMAIVQSAMAINRWTSLARPHGASVGHHVA